MVDFEFYVNQYLGCRIPEKSFPQMALRAQEALRSFERCCRVSGGETERKMAICAMAETLYEDHCRRGVAAQSVGSVTVRYDAGRSLRQQLFEKAAIYLDIYRGVG